MSPNSSNSPEPVGWDPGPTGQGKGRFWEEEGSSAQTSHPLQLGLLVLLSFPRASSQEEMHRVQPPVYPKVPWPQVQPSSG